MRRITILLAALLLALFGAGQAMADPGGSAAQAAGQSASSGQSAGAGSGAFQAGPTNSASSIRVLSPGNDGTVSQSNTTTAGALAANGNATSQATDQSQLGGGVGSGATQIAGQEAANRQDANADAMAVQLAPTNEAGSIRVLSPGNGGNLDQSNSATAGAAALNDNGTDQTTDQSQAGSGYASSSTQIAGQKAANDQSAEANAAALQVKPSNTASSIRVLSPGDDGDVSQSNDATALGIAANGNETGQSIDQSQGGTAAPAYGDARRSDPKSGYGSDSTQVAGQEASNDQTADANAAAVQWKPSNTASSIRVLSPGDDGDVSQSNSTTAVAAALNGNATDQSIDQSQGGSPASYAGGERSKGEKSGSDSTQVAGQKATNAQSAEANAAALQVKPSNTASSIRVLSPGNGGDVTQSNDATALGIAANGNRTSQDVTQSQGGGGNGSGYTQVAGQEAKSTQSAGAGALAVQVAPSNTSRSIRVLSPGDDGNVTQSNGATAVAAALNGNATSQSIDQAQAGKGHGGAYLQVAGQGAWSRQDAAAGAAAVQLGASNENAPVRVGSPGGGGSVEQSNEVGALALALNLNETCQSLVQEQAGSGAGQLQVAGQGSWDDQRGGAWSRAIQGGMHAKKRR